MLRSLLGGCTAITDTATGQADSPLGCTIQPPTTITHAHIMTVSSRYGHTVRPEHAISSPIKVVFGPEEAHLVGAVAHDGRSSPGPQPQQPLLLCHCHSTVNGPLHSHTLSLLLPIPVYAFQCLRDSCAMTLFTSVVIIPSRAWSQLGVKSLKTSSRPQLWCPTHLVCCM